MKTNITRDTEMDSINSKDEMLQTDVLSIQSPSCDVTNLIEGVPPAACESLASPSEDTSSRKKPRLHWGEGLAKFEKKKVEGVDDCVTSNAPVVYNSSSKQLLVDSTKSANESPIVNASLLPLLPMVLPIVAHQLRKFSQGMKTTYM